jgi:DNA-binding transcriptional regulator YhcF (GntR family)
MDFDLPNRYDPKLRNYINPNSSDTLTEQVTNGLREDIKKGIFKQGKPLPSLRRLANASGVSSQITRRAVNKLVEEGLIVSHQSGSYVRYHK